jgi:endonuclease/exonuclease/phosphatase family metal-dependent hydrolase
MKKLKYVFLFILTSFAFQNNFAATDTIKVMDWNILNFAGTDTSRVQYYRTVISSASPDIFVCQEINGTAANRVLFRQVFEAFAPGVYDTVTFVDGPDSDNLLFFKKSKASFISNTAHHTELRDISEFKMYFPYISDTVRFFSCHLKASTGTANEDQRGREADTLRYFTNQLPAGKYFMLMGDFNFYKATEPAYIHLLAAGGIDGKFNDPITGMTGNWNSVVAYSQYYTQSPRVRSFGGGAAGGMDDRFDLILHSNACLNNANKFYYVPNSHIAYGNDGNHLNDSINKMPNTAVSAAVADGIHYASDHIPVISRFVLNNQIAPVELSSFVSLVSANSVELKWSTVSELNNSGFEIERKSSFEWQKIAFVNGAGTSNISNTYGFLDKALQSGSYQYRLKQIDFNGNFEYFNLSSEVHIGTPDKFALAQNYPNPFNPSTLISFNIPADGFVSLAIYDLSGKEVMNVIQENKAAGYYSLNINASALPSGTYFYRFSAGDYTSVRKMVLLK